MKALSVYPKYAMLIASGDKTREYRSYPTKYRGDLLICSTRAHGEEGTIPRHAVCVVELADCVRLSKYEYAWKLKNPRVIKPVFVRGQQRIFETDVVPEPCPDYETEEEIEQWHEKYFYPMVKGAYLEDNGEWYVPEVDLDEY